MLDEEKLRKLYETVAKIDGKIKLKDIYKLLNELGLKSYPPSVIILIKKIKPDKQEDQIEEMQEVLTFSQFKLLAEIIENPFQKSLFLASRDIKQTIRVINQDMSNRDMTVRDRQLESKFKIRVGPEQAYKQEMKIEILKNAQKKITTPWLSLQFDVQEQNKSLVQKTINQVFNRLLQLIISQNVKSEESIKKITIETSQTEKGVRAVIEIRNQRFNQIQEIMSIFFDQILKTAVNGRIMFSVKFNKSVYQLIDLSRIQHIFSVISKDCEIIFECSLGKIMSGIKQIIPTIPAFFDIQYNKFDIPSILAILFSNTEDMDAELEFQNVEYTPEELEDQTFSSLNEVRIQTISQLKESAPEMLGEFGLLPLFQLIGDSISVQCSFGTFDFSLFFKFENLSGILKQLFSGEGNQNGSGNGDESRNQSQPVDQQGSNSSEG